MERAFLTNAAPDVTLVFLVTKWKLVKARGRPFSFDILTNYVQILSYSYMKRNSIIQ